MPEVFDRLFSLYYFDNPNFKVWQPITHMFMHADFMHILFNMFALYMFGSPLEMVWGKKKFLFFYFSAGLGAAVIHTLVNYYHVQSGFQALLDAGRTPTQILEQMADIMSQVASNATGQYSTREYGGVPIQQIGAMTESYEGYARGASGAVMGVLVAFGLLYPNMELMLLFLPIPIKAKYFIPVLVLIDLFSGLTGVSLFGQGIAHWAHLGGALFGFVMAYYWKKNSFNNRRWN